MDNEAKLEFITELVDTVIESHDLSEWGDHEVYFLAKDIKAALDA